MAPDRGGCNYWPPAYPLAASRLGLPGGRLDEFRPPRVGSALEGAHRVHPAVVVVEEKRTASIDSKAKSFHLSVHLHDIAAPEPAFRKPEEISDCLLFPLADFDVVVRAAGAAVSATGAAKAQTGNPFLLSRGHPYRIPVVFSAGLALSHPPDAEAPAVCLSRGGLFDAPQGSQRGNRTAGYRQRKLDAPDVVERP